MTILLKSKTSFLKSIDFWEIIIDEQTKRISTVDSLEYIVNMVI